MSYRAEELLTELPQVRGVMVGEGEETFARLAKAYREAEQNHMPWNSITGIVVRGNNNEIIELQKKMVNERLKRPILK